MVERARMFLYVHFVSLNRCHTLQLAITYLKLTPNSSHALRFIGVAHTHRFIVANYEIIEIVYVYLNREELMGIADRWFTKALTTEDVDTFFKLIKDNQVSYKE